MTLLIEIFASKWVRDDLDNNDSWINKFLSGFMDTIRSLYDFPLIFTVQMAQCQNFNDDQDNGIITRENGALYSASALLVIFTIYLGHKIIKLYFFKEQVDENQLRVDALIDDKR